ncbi:MAG: putative glycosyltransferase, exosortase G system-associated [Lachnospiraceae bacterium]|nr:putative glycosyltransferase, exosortase G system-associated [Lachnospiraceae bacterium]
MDIMTRILNSFIAWGAWILIPVLMEVVPAAGSFFLLLKRQLRSSKKADAVTFFPEISLIVPVYNSEDTLFNCIRSINDSTYPSDRINVFLVNNQGKDNSFSVFAKCQEAFPKLHLQWMNAKQGKSRALNLALYNSEGKYIINIDSDGVLETHALENMIRKFEANPDLNCMTGAILTMPELIKKHPTLWGRLLRKLEFMEYAQAFLAGRSYASEINSVYTLSGAFSAFRKSAILKSRLYNTDTICEDTQLTFQMRQIFKERVEVCENALFLVDPIESADKLYTQRQRWQRGSLEVGKMFMGKDFRLRSLFTNINVKTLLYDHTFAFPRMIWYLALICLLFLNYSGKIIIYSTIMIFLLYIVIGYLYFLTASHYLKAAPDLRKFYRQNWYCVILLPFFNLAVFFIRLAGIINSIGTDSAWRTKTLSDEREAFADVVKKDFEKPAGVYKKIFDWINSEDDKQDAPDTKLQQ